MLEALSVSTLAVAVAEIGDKTQLLAIVLAAKYRRPIPILLGILVATLANHALAALAGVMIADMFTGAWFRVGVGAAFIAMAAWALIPDQAGDGPSRPYGGVFLTTLVAFFLVEMGDKTQIATALLAARFQEVAAVTVGATLGMMLANTPAVLLGQAAARTLPMAYVRIVAALIFAALGAWLIAAALG